MVNLSRQCKSTAVQVRAVVKAVIMCVNKIMSAFFCNFAIKSAG
nr:MAG TPA: hypothetical protein [Caudoviricetes sp.]DAV70264.1 MAG TPA: hypothetical protein [Caudoviricetes sp.]DAY71506.1 MAG TPA: hypothetical protein [Caudoviricetes sp.]